MLTVMGLLTSAVAGTNKHQAGQRMAGTVRPATHRGSPLLLRTMTVHMQHMTVHICHDIGHADRMVALQTEWLIRHLNWHRWSSVLAAQSIARAQKIQGQAARSAQQHCARVDACARLAWLTPALAMRPPRWIGKQAAGASSYASPRHCMPPQAGTCANWWQSRACPNR